jgi:hypothetical protein
LETCFTLQSAGGLDLRQHPEEGGKQPYSPDAILKRRIRPAATRAKIAKRIGWHTFRRTFSTLLKAKLAGGRQSGAGTAAARECEDHARCVCADCHAGQAARAVEGGGDAAGGKGNEGEILLDPSGPSAISEEAVSD